MKLSTKEFCARLRKAKIEAVQLFNADMRFSSRYCISIACTGENLVIMKWYDQNAFFSHPAFRYSNEWVRDCAKTPADIARVFDASIIALGEQP